MRVTPSVARMRKVLTRTEIGWIAAWLAVLGGIEYAGRFSPSDAWDTLAVATLATLVALTARYHVKIPLGWVTWILSGVRRIGGALQRLWLEFGVDLREEPRLPARLPVGPILVVSLLAAAAAALYAGREALPLGMRSALAGRLYVLYAVLLAALWALMVGGILVMLSFPLMLIHDRFVQSFVAQGRRPVRWELIAMIAYVALLVAAMALLPGALPLWGCAGLCAFNLVAIWTPFNPSLKVLWRSPRADARPRTFDWRWLIVFELTTLSLAVCCLLLAAGTRTAAESVWNEMPVTTALGWLLGWIGLGGLAFLTVHYACLLSLGRFRNPARPAPRSALVEGVLSAATRRRVHALLTGHAWKVRFAPSARRRADVVVRLDEDAPAADPAFVGITDPVQPRTLEHPEFLWRLGRRDEIQRRRMLLRALEKLFKRAARRSFRQGSGFWVAPHLWFMMGLQRDADEEDPDLAEGGILYQIIGPPYHRIVPRAARHHFLAVMRGIGVDLIFVEDGVGFRKLRNALRVLFEVYDVHGGRLRVEERHLTGLHGLRAIIHELEPDAPFRPGSYPEPDYEHIGRARILHLFRDRSEDEERSETPVDIDSVPVPSLA